MEIIKSVDDCSRFNFMKSSKKHYLAACKHILEKTPESSSIVRSLKCFHPAERKTVNSCKDIVAVAKALQLNVEYDELIDEWKSPQLESQTMNDNERIDEYWSKLTSTKNSINKLKYPLTSMVTKAALVLSHENADVERSFLSSSRVLTEDRASLSERTLNCLMVVKSGIKIYNNKPELVPVTRELISSARGAYRSYETYLSEERRQKELNDQKKEER